MASSPTIVDLRRRLREAWMNRARLFYDGRIPQSYLRHRFTTNRDRIYSPTPLEKVHTIDVVDSFAPRASQNFNYRNPVADQRKFQRLMGLHLSDGMNDAIFADYQRHGRMTKAQYYLETHIDLNYKILFFILELKLRGIKTDADDTHRGSISDADLSNLVQNLFTTDEDYKNYLIDLRARLEKLRRNEFGNCFSNGAEEDLIFLFMRSIENKNSASYKASSAVPKNSNGREMQCGQYFSSSNQLNKMLPKPNQ